MDLPAKVFIYNSIMSLSGASGTLVAIRPDGAYEVRLNSQGRPHVVLLPVASTAIVMAEPEPEFGPDFDVER